jgi:HK97 family phage prohead protease
MPTDYIQNIDGAERRMVSEGLEMREEGEAQYFEGYAFVYGAVADIGPFTEEIARGAADSVMKDDVRGLFNHGPNLVLGRTTSKTMTISADERGLKYSISYNPKDPDHVSLMEKIKRGDVSQSSFAFRTETDKWETRNGKDHRTITKFKRLIDVSPVTYPAYNEATVAARSLDKIKSDYKKDLADMGLALMKQELNSKQK